MKKEKKVRTYQRRTKSGKTVTVKAHTAKYDAAEKAKEMAQKKGAGKELEERRKQPVQLEIPFEEGDEKKVLDEIKEKEKSEKKDTTTTKKRPIGTGTNGPEKKATSRKPSVEKQLAEQKGVQKVGTYDGYKIYQGKGKRLYFYDSDIKWLVPIASLGPKSAAEVKELVKSKESKATKGTTAEPSVKAKVAPKKSESKSTTDKPFTAVEFKEWYHGTGSAADKKVAKALRAQLGSAGYRKLENEAVDNYSSRGHLAMFKKLSPEQYSKEKGQRQLAGAAKAQKAVAEKMGAKDAAKKFDKIAKENSPAKSKPTSKELKQQYEEALASERKAEIKNNRNANKSLYEKYGTTHKEVADFMRTSKRKWRWDRATNSFVTPYMPDGKSKMRGISKLSLESALKRYAKNSTSKESTVKKDKTYSVSYRGSDGKVHTEHFTDKASADDFKANFSPIRSMKFI